jgi:SagB-type dehydrogenase family enzyme
MQQISQLLWAAQGVTRPSWGGRTAPSAGGTYPLGIYLVVAKNGVEGLATGIYRYIPQNHKIVSTVLGDRTSELSAAALNQTWVADARINIVIAAVYERTTNRYGERGVQYVHMEAGHAAQNIYLETAALNLGMVSVGAFNDEQIQKVCEIPDEQKPLYIIPVGHP